MTERTLASVKSGAVTRGAASAILLRAETAGLKVVWSRPLHLTRDVIEAFYVEHVGRDYFERLAGSVSGKDGVVVAVLEGENVIQKWRTLLGATDPEKAIPGTIRNDFGTALPDNAAHGSDSPENAAREIAIMERAAATAGLPVAPPVGS